MPAAVMCLIKAVKAVITPEPSPTTSAAVRNAKARRRRVQAKVGEVLTSEESLYRLHQEMKDKENKNSKIKKQPQIKKKDLKVKH